MSSNRVSGVAIEQFLAYIYFEQQRNKLERKHNAKFSVTVLRVSCNIYQFITTLNDPSEQFIKTKKTQLQVLKQNEILYRTLFQKCDKNVSLIIFDTLVDQIKIYTYLVLLLLLLFNIIIICLLNLDIVMKMNSLYNQASNPP